MCGRDWAPPRHNGAGIMFPRSSRRSISRKSHVNERFFFPPTRPFDGLPDEIGIFDRTGSNRVGEIPKPSDTPDASGRSRVSPTCRGTC